MNSLINIKNPTVITVNRYKWSAVYNVLIINLELQGYIVQRRIAIQIVRLIHNLPRPRRIAVAVDSRESLLWRAFINGRSVYVVSKNKSEVPLKKVKVTKCKGQVHSDFSQVYTQCEIQERNEYRTCKRQSIRRSTRQSGLHFYKEKAYNTEQEEL